MIVDANLLLYAVDDASPHHGVASAWLTSALNGEERVGLPWQTLGAFVRIITHPRIAASPLSPSRAAGHVSRWLAAEPSWIPAPGESTARTFVGMVERYGVSGNLVPDAMLAALAVEHGQVIYSADSDFARFPEITWRNPLLPRA